VSDYFSDKTKLMNKNGEESITVRWKLLLHPNESDSFSDKTKRI